MCVLDAAVIWDQEIDVCLTTPSFMDGRMIRSKVLLGLESSRSTRAEKTRWRRDLESGSRGSFHHPRVGEERPEIWPRLSYYTRANGWILMSKPLISEHIWWARFWVFLSCVKNFLFTLINADVIIHQQIIHSHNNKREKINDGTAIVRKVRSPIIASVRREKSY